MVQTRRSFILTLLLAALPLLGWWSTGLFDLDEGFYGAITAEMNRRGEWITPYLAGRPWFEKPILLYWLAKPSLMLFGEMVGPRVPSVLATIVTLALVGWYGKRNFGERVGRLAMLILGGTLLFSGLGRLMMTDPLLVLCITAGFLLFEESLRGMRHARWLSGLAIGISVLAKGPVAVLLLVPLLLWRFFRFPELRGQLRGGWLGFFAAFVVAVASWYLPAYLINGDLFVQKFLIEQNLRRFTGGDEAHTLGGPAAFAFFVPVFLLGFMPWSFVLLGNAIVHRKNRQTDERLLFLIAWAVIVFAFFSVSGAKLIHYIMPMFPPLALVLAATLDRHSKFLERWFVAAGVWVVLLFGLLNVALPLLDSPPPLPKEAREKIIAIRDEPRTPAFLSRWLKDALNLVDALPAPKEAREKIIALREQPGTLVFYQIGRREASKGTGTLQLRETSLPSLRLYAKRDALDVESIADLQTLPSPLIIFTRKDRISDAEAIEFGLMQQPTKPEDRFVVFVR